MNESMNELNTQVFLGRLTAFIFAKYAKLKITDVGIDEQKR